MYETAPVGGPEQDPYLNAVVVLDSGLEAPALLNELQAIEKSQGRQRKVRWGARTLDLDILTSDGPEFDSPELTIPHPRLMERQFALVPLAEVWPDAPVGGGNEAAGAVGSVPDQGVVRLPGSWQSPGPSTLGKLYVAVQLTWFVLIAVALAWDGSLPDGSSQPLRIAGGVLAVLGAALAFISSRRLGSSLTAIPEPLDDARLVETGPFALARHPIYGGVTIFILGTALILDSTVAALMSLVLFPFFYFKSEYEEGRLRMKYSAYSAYRDRVPRRFIPYLF